jgi:hypothetical protein
MGADLLSNFIGMTLQATGNNNSGATFSGMTGLENANHTHSGSGVTGTENQSHSHNQSIPGGNHVGGGGSFGFDTPQAGTVATSTESANHNHNFSFTTGTESANHGHPFSGTTDAVPSSGGTEARPEALAVTISIRY